jgi:TetR/AcrR family transcriptional regulator, tetracycline repressor protein
MPRPKVPLLSRSKIVEVALELIDEEGTDQLTIRKVARRLGVQGPSIYYYFRDRDELFAAVGLTLLQDVKIPKRRSQKWTEWLVQDSIAYFRAIEAHPNMASILFERRTRPGAAGRFNAALEQMADSGMSPADGLALIDAVEGLALSWLSFAGADTAREEFGNLDRMTYPMLDVARRKHQLDEASYRRTIVALIVGFEQLYCTKQS